MYMLRHGQAETGEKVAMASVSCRLLSLIYSQCGAPASWAARHSTMCLDIYVLCISVYYGTVS